MHFICDITSLNFNLQTGGQIKIPQVNFSNTSPATNSTHTVILDSAANVYKLLEFDKWNKWENTLIWRQNTKCSQEPWCSLSLASTAILETYDFENNWTYKTEKITNIASRVRKILILKWPPYRTCRQRNSSVCLSVSTSRHVTLGNFSSNCRTILLLHKWNFVTASVAQSKNQLLIFAL